MIYFDNSATTYYKPECVIGAVSSTLGFVSANAGRAGHHMAAMAASLVYSTRKSFASLLGADAERVVFCGNCTDALNQAILGTVRKGGHVVTTAYEHNSVLRPLHELARRGTISLTILSPNPHLIVTADMIERAIRPSTYLVAVNHVSNVTGATSPIAQIGNVVRKHQALFLVDGAQSVGYMDVDMQESCIDMLAVAPHKGLHAPQGVGVLALNERVEIRPTRFGGTGTASLSLYQPLELPESLEAGTLATPIIAGANAAVGWTKKNLASNRARLAALSTYFGDNLKMLRNVAIYTPKNNQNGIFSFNIGDISSSVVSNILSEEYDICTRSGLHCAPLIHKHLGTETQGTVRASLSAENTEKEIDTFFDAIRHIAKK